jgi:hypothetical protein
MFYGGKIKCQSIGWVVIPQSKSSIVDRKGSDKFSIPVINAIKWTVIKHNRQEFRFCKDKFNKVTENSPNLKHSEVTKTLLTIIQFICRHCLL